MSEVMVGSLDEFADGDYRILAVGGLEVGIFRDGARLVAYENLCPHYGGPVCQGKVYNRVEEMLQPDLTSRGLRFAAEKHVICPWHGYEFDLATGRHPGDPNVRLKPVGIALRDDRVYVAVPD